MRTSITFSLFVAIFSSISALGAEFFDPGNFDLSMITHKRPAAGGAQVTGSAAPVFSDFPVNDGPATYPGPEYLSDEASELHSAHDGAVGSSERNSYEMNIQTSPPFPVETIDEHSTFADTITMPGYGPSVTPATSTIVVQETSAVVSAAISTGTVDSETGATNTTDISNATLTSVMPTTYMGGFTTYPGGYASSTNTTINITLSTTPNGFTLPTAISGAESFGCHLTVSLVALLASSFLVLWL